MAFHAVDNEIGIIVFIDGQVAGMELLAKFYSFSKTYSKLVHSYVMDALETVQEKKRTSNQSLKGKAAKLLDEAQHTRLEARPSVGLGNDLRLESDRIIGAGLELDRHLLQLSIFPKEHNGTYMTKSVIQRASRRRDLLRE